MDIAIAPGIPLAPEASPQAAAVEARSVVYRYGERTALDGLSLEVPSGAIFGLLGPNGSGKSTLLSIIIGRRVAAAGEVRVIGAPLTDAVRARMGVVFQEPSLDPQMTVRETMRLQARMFGLPRLESEAAATTLLERVSLADRAGTFTRELSGGMKRRLELARALLTDPELLLLDEPTLALDPDSRLALWEYLLEANAQGRTLLLATNDVSEAERYCHTVALIADGRLVAQGRPDDLKRDLRHESVRIDWLGGPAPDEIGMVEEWPGVGHVRLAGHTMHVTVDDASPFLARLFQHTQDRVRTVRIDESTLEDVYFQLVGRVIRRDGDDDAEQAP